MAPPEQLNIPLPYKIHHISPAAMARLYRLLEPIVKEATDGSERLTKDELNVIITRLSQEKATIDRQADSPELVAALNVSLVTFQAMYHNASHTQGLRILLPEDPTYQQVLEAHARYNQAPSNHPVALPGLMLVDDSPRGRNSVNASYTIFGDIMTINAKTLELPADLQRAIYGHELGHKGQLLKVGYLVATFDNPFARAKEVAPNMVAACQAAGRSEASLESLFNGSSSNGRRNLSISMEDSSLGSDAIRQPTHEITACNVEISKAFADNAAVKKAVADVNLAIGRWMESDADRAAIASEGGLSSARLSLRFAANGGSLDHRPFQLTSDPHPSNRDRIRAAGYEVSLSTGGEPDSRGAYVLTPVAVKSPQTDTAGQLASPLPHVKRAEANPDKSTVTL